MEKTKTEIKIEEGIEFLKTIKEGEELIGFLVLWADKIKSDFRKSL